MTLSAENREKLARRIFEAEVDLAGVRAAFASGNATLQQVQDEEEILRMLRASQDQLIAQESAALVNGYIEERNRQADSAPNPLTPR